MCSLTQERQPSTLGDPAVRVGPRDDRNPPISVTRRACLNVRFRALAGLRWMTVMGAKPPAPHGAERPVQGSPDWPPIGRVGSITGARRIANERLQGWIPNLQSGTDHVLERARAFGSGGQSAPNAAVTACRIGSCAVFGGTNMRLWQIVTANRLSGSAQAMEPPAPGWPMARGFWPI